MLRVILTRQMFQSEFEVKMGLKTGRSNLSNVERRSRVLPLDYLAKVMSSLGMRAVIVRPGLVNWNPISRTHTIKTNYGHIGKYLICPVR